MKCRWNVHPSVRHVKGQHRRPHMTATSNTGRDSPSSSSESSGRGRSRPCPGHATRPGACNSQTLSEFGFATLASTILMASVVVGRRLGTKNECRGGSARARRAGAHCHGIQRMGLGFGEGVSEARWHEMSTATRSIISRPLAFVHLYCGSCDISSSRICPDMKVGRERTARRPRVGKAGERCGPAVLGSARPPSPWVVGGCVMRPPGRGGHALDAGDSGRDLNLVARCPGVRGESRRPRLVRPSAGLRASSGGASSAQQVPFR
jgi:hypothetical protein